MNNEELFKARFNQFESQNCILKLEGLDNYKCQGYGINNKLKKLYDNIRLEFFNELANNSQEDAIKVLVKKYGIIRK